MKNKLFHINYNSPICLTGYGIVSLNILRELYKIDNNIISYFPMGQPNLQNEYDHKIVSEMFNNRYLFDIHAPFIKIWHQFDLGSRIGRGKYFAFPFFELDTFDKSECIHMSVPDVLFVSSKWAQDIVKSNNIKTESYVVPLGVDRDIFDHNIKSTRVDNKYIFLNIGKWEVRKGHDILLELFNKAFPNETDVELCILASETTNSYSNPEELIRWKSIYNSPRVKLLHGVETHREVAQLIANSDCGIYPSRAEGWNLELLETMSMNKPVIATNYSSHTEFCNQDNCFLVDIDKVEPAHDGKVFNGQGNWAKIGEQQKEQIISHMRYAYNNRLSQNPQGLETAKKYGWNKTANIIMERISQ